METTSRYLQPSILSCSLLLMCDQNTPWNPTEISPQRTTAPFNADSQFFVNANTFTIFSFTGLIPTVEPKVMQKQ